MPHQLTSLSIVLPAFNEEAVVATVIKQCAMWLDDHIPRHEIIVVNDGSTDRTGAVVRSLLATYPSLRVLDHATNQGYGEALRTGFTAAQHEWILLMDADGQFTITSLRDFLPYTGQYDFISGIREQRADRVLRTWLTKVYFWLIRRLFAIRLHDISCGFKLFRRQCWQNLPTITARDNKVFTLEWLLAFKKQGVRMKELPISHFPRTTGRATGGQWRLILPTLLSLSALWYRHYRNEV